MEIISEIVLLSKSNNIFVIPFHVPVHPARTKRPIQSFQQSTLASAIWKGKLVLGGGFDAMPPKKKIRNSAPAARAIASGDQSQQVAQNMESVCTLMQAAQKCVESIYSLRHSTRDTINAQALPELPLAPSGDQYVWPVLKGGIFKDIAQHAFQSPDKLLAESWEMVVAAGILDTTSSPETLQQKFCVIEDRGCQW